jgi:hypothetical protein
MNEKKEIKDVMIISTKDLSPQEIADFGCKAAVVLKDIVDKTKSKVNIKGNDYLKFEAWQTIGKFYGSTVIIEWTKPIMRGVDVFGYEARANVVDKDGRIISSAESSCSKDDPNWEHRGMFQIRSMAQTRACSKAFRNVYSWVVVLAGYQATPAEEMVDDEPDVKRMAPAKAVPANNTPVAQRPKNPVCVTCKKAVTEKVYDYSMNNFGMSLCFDHQNEFKKQNGVRTSTPDDGVDYSEFEKENDEEY